MDVSRLERSLLKFEQRMRLVDLAFFAFGCGTVEIVGPRLRKRTLACFASPNKVVRIQFQNETLEISLANLFYRKVPTLSCVILRCAKSNFPL